MYLKNVCVAKAEWNLGKIVLPESLVDSDLISFSWYQLNKY